MTLTAFQITSNDIIPDHGGGKDPNQNVKTVPIPYDQTLTVLLVGNAASQYQFDPNGPVTYNTNASQYLTYPPINGVVTQLLLTAKAGSYSVGSTQATFYFLDQKTGKRFRHDPDIPWIGKPPPL